ncbi:MAG: CHAD domain-containing protein [Elainellaceae cyanobacterium]
MAKTKRSSTAQLTTDSLTRDQAAHDRSHPSSDALSTYAYEAIATHLQTVIQHEANVLADTDPEAIHQMRVGLRRLRTTLEAYGMILQLPPDAQIKRIKKLAGVLGQVRDLDVLQERLKGQYRGQLPKAEKKRLDKLLKRLHKQRKRAFSTLKKTFSGKTYQQFKAAYVEWLNQPTYTPLADYATNQVLPDLLLPIISDLMLHPGWLAGRSLQPESTTPDQLSLWLDQEGVILHSLRKQMKRVRYQTEFFTPFYGSAYKTQVKEFKTIQDILGQIQDCWVLNQRLTQEIGTHWQSQLPTLATILQGDRQTLWRSWYPLQQQYLTPKFRQSLRLLVAQPQDLELELGTVDLDSSTLHSPADSPESDSPESNSSESDASDSDTNGSSGQESSPA